jgi:hypothetical protein
MVHHDALEFSDGRIVLLTFLGEGQKATVLQLPAGQKRMRSRWLVASLDDALNIGFCLGLAHAFLNLGDDLWPSAQLCPPQDTIVNRTLRVAVHYMEAHPERLHEPIAELFIEALQQAWPCKE